MIDMYKVEALSDFHSVALRQRLQNVIRVNRSIIKNAIFRLARQFGAEASKIREQWMGYWNFEAKFKMYKSPKGTKFITPKKMQLKRYYYLNGAVYFQFVLKHCVNLITSALANKETFVTGLAANSYELISMRTLETLAKFKGVKRSMTGTAEKKDQREKPKRIPSRARNKPMN